MKKIVLILFLLLVQLGRLNAQTSFGKNTGPVLEKSTFSNPYN